MAGDHLEMRDIRKSFSGVTVLDGVDLQVKGGRVAALLGENGAGKSTLMKIMTGVYTPDSGRVLVNGQEVAIPNVASARRFGIEMIHQELNLFANLTIAENFLIGNETRYRKFGMVDYAKLHSAVTKVLASLHLQRDVAEPLSALSVGERQLVEIGKALLQDVRFLAMDEPTSALSQPEIERLFEIISQLKAKGVGIIYISHRLEELFRIADDVTVLRDGQFIATQGIAETSQDALVSLMVGRDIAQRYPRTPSSPGSVRIACRGLTTTRVQDVSLVLRSGEIVGIGGLMGAGRTEVARALCGIDKIQAGDVQVDGETVRLRSPADAIRRGVAFVTEDRKEQGLVLPFSVQHNMSLPTLAKRAKYGLVQERSERTYAARLVQQLRVKVSSLEQPVERLSGGNQQKVVIGKWLGHAPSVFILDEPTRGVDVGAKQEIYQLMNDLKAEGKAVLMISSDLPELLGMSDRVYVMYEGRLQGELSGEALTEAAFMRLATGGASA